MKLSGNPYYSKGEFRFHMVLLNIEEKTILKINHPQSYMHEVRLCRIKINPWDFEIGWKLRDQWNGEKKEL